MKRWEVYNPRTGEIVCVGTRRYTRKVWRQNRQGWARHKVEITHLTFEGMGETLP